MKIWMKHTIVGGFHNNAAGVQAGEVVDVEPWHAERYVEHGLAEMVNEASGAAHF